MKIEKEKELLKLQDHVDGLYKGGYIKSGTYDDVTLAIVKNLIKLKQDKIEFTKKQSSTFGGMGMGTF